jgi:hypothetical protein
MVLGLTYTGNSISPFRKLISADYVKATGFSTLLLILLSRIAKVDITDCPYFRQHGQVEVPRVTCQYGFLFIY